MRITQYAVRIAAIAVLLFFLLLGMWIGRFVPAAHPWTLEHLRLLDDSFAPRDMPASDISAVFARPAGTRCEIRLDFLDLPDPPEYQFTLLLPPSPNGRGVGGEGKILVFSSDSPPPPDARLSVDTVTDIITLSLADCQPESDTPLRVETPAERLETTFGAQVEIQPLALQFVFTNTFPSCLGTCPPAATPIQAWRRWDGAHTGPRGERHGLRGLLNAAEKRQIPLTLYDTNTPAALSAIDAAGGTEQLRRMETSGLLALPPGPAPAASFLQFELSRNGLPLEARQSLLSSASARLRFSDSSVVQSASSVSSVPPSASPTCPAPSSGVHPLSNPLLMGGDFQRSTWGTYEYAEPSFAWLKARPYFFIESTGLPVEATGTVDSINATKEMLEKSDPALAQNYAWVVPLLETAARWSENPKPVTECKDLCILASDTFYAVFHPRGGRLVFFFAGPEQVIGPTAQFFIGLSDRSQWDVSKGEGAADPAQIMGAFGDADDAFRPYQPEITENSIRFVSADGREKTYRLTETGLEAVFSPVVESQIPLALAPQTRFTPNWAGKYRLERLTDGIRLEVAGGPMVRIQVTAGQVRAVDSFLDAIPFIASPENPNLELSPGFFLPFPLTVVHLSASEVSMTVRR